MNPTRLSKRLSLVLRHDPSRIGLTIDGGGWAVVEELLRCLRESDTPATLDELRQVVADNDKQRFRFSDDGLRIRANQGHSIAVELDLEPVTPPEFLYHGTATRFLEAILRDGLERRSRRHVHLSLDVETATAVGKRHGKPASLRIRAREMQAAGHSFYLSENGVWLTESVPVEFIED
jgi:putative RNA 2'-phosphotransferase